MKKIFVSFVVFPFISTFLNAQNLKVDSLDLSEYQKKISLPKELNENSGLEFIDEFLYTFNDSGGRAEVYKIKPETGEIVQTIAFPKLKNIDFEDITFDGKNLYIGDFGNNLGMRKDLKIYYFDITKISNKKEVEVNPKVIEFEFSNQTDFENRGWVTTNFDLESMAYYKGKIHLFTKEWSSYKSTHYALDIKKTGTKQSLQPLESFSTECVITAADFTEKGELYLVGYTKEGVVSLWKFSNYKNGLVFNGKAKKTFLGLTPAVSQIEAICIGKNELFISGEEFEKKPFYIQPTLYRLPL